MVENNDKLVSFKKEVVVPHELTDKFLKYIEKFKQFMFHAYLIDEDDIAEISKYKIVISNPREPFEGLYNNVFVADINFEVLEKNVRHTEYVEKKYKMLLNLLSEANILDDLKYSIEMYEIYDSLQAKIFAI